VIRDSIRISYFELGRIHYQYGFLSDAIKNWSRSLDYANNEEDLFNITYHLAQASFENQSNIYLIKYAGEAEARERALSKGSSRTAQVKTLDALASLQNENFKDAVVKFCNTVNVSDDGTQFNEFVLNKDIAYYVVIGSLHSLNRGEIKNLILNGSSYKALMESTNDERGAGVQVSDVIENFLNGRYMDYQRQIAFIAS
jgi:hypothetical protein